MEERTPKVVLRKNPNPVWDMDFIHHFEVYGPSCYHVHPTVEQIQQEKFNVRNGTPGSRLSDIALPFAFEIFAEGKLVGDITLNRGEADWEFSMVVLGAYLGNGIGREALRQFIAQNEYWPLCGIIQRTNPKSSRLLRFLKSMGFRRVSGELWKGPIIMQMNTKAELVRR